MRLRGGSVRLTLGYCTVTAGRKNCIRYEIAGSQSALAWDSQSPNELWIGRRDGPNEVLIRDPALLSPVGFVPAENLIGPAKILFWSYDETFSGTNPLTWVTALRWKRLLNLID